MPCSTIQPKARERRRAARRFRAVTASLGRITLVLYRKRTARQCATQGLWMRCNTQSLPQPAHWEKQECTPEENARTIRNEEYSHADYTVNDGPVPVII